MYTKDRMAKLLSLQLQHRRVRRTSSRLPFTMPSRLKTVNGRLINAESRTIANYPVLRAIAAPYSTVNHQPLSTLYVITRYNDHDSLYDRFFHFLLALSPADSGESMLIYLNTPPQNCPPTPTYLIIAFCEMMRYDTDEVVMRWDDEEEPLLYSDGTFV
jgi:hypothetical protein